MNIEDLILRTTASTPFTTKGSRLTWVELDGNLILIGNSIIAIDNPGGVPAYSDSTSYSGTQYVSYDSKLWKHIAAGPTVGIAPDTDDTKWSRVSVGVLTHQTNKDTQLEGPVDGITQTVTIEQLYNLLAGGNIKTFDVDITSAEILVLNTTPKVLATPASGKAIELISARVELLHEDSPASIAYTVNTTLQIKANGAGRVQSQITNILASASRIAVVAGLSGGAQDLSQILTDADLVATVNAGDPLLGDYDIKISGIYREITLSI